MIKKIILHILRYFGYDIVKLKKNSSKPNLPTIHNQSIHNYWLNQKYLEKQEFKYILWIDRVFDKIQKVPGHIVELGVAYGRNTIIFSHLIDMHNESDIRKYYGFDTFNGYNEESLINNKNLSSNSWKNISVDAINERINKAQTRTKVSFIKGDIIETVPEFIKENPDLRIALLYVDCNAYLPSLEGMRLFKDFMSPGGVICIDEKRQGGEIKALIQFCKENNLIFQKDKSPFSIPAYTVL